jgi:hypothetical protein
VGKAKPPPEVPTFFIDCCLGSVDVAAALKSAGAVVEIHLDHFPQDAKDVDWLPVVGAKKWIVLTKDKAIRRREVEIDALIAAGVGAFFLTSGQSTGKENAKSFVAALPKMLKIVAKRTRPFVATISEGGNLAIVKGGERKGGIKRG